jgi:predicted CXXCH cytochrome family protein
MSPSTHHRRPSLVRRVGVACAVVAALVLCPLPASGGWLWDAGIAIGYVALVTAATLYLYPLRGEGLPHKRLFTLSQHRRIGWIALTLGLLHAAVLLVTQPQVGHYLLPSAPLYMLFGLAALIGLAILVATGLSARTALRNSPSPTTSPPHAPTSVATHAILAALLLAVTAAHLLGSHQLADKPAKTITLCALLALPLLWAALRSALRRQVRKGDCDSPPLSTLRKPPRLRLFPTVLPGCAAAAILFLLPIPTAETALLQPATPPSLLPVYFPHEKHTTVGCVTCHHNFVDKTGLGSCRDCHRSARTDLPESAEATFHTFCRNCHTELAQTTTKHGPTRACSTCHAKEPPPLTQAATDSPARSVFSAP